MQRIAQFISGQQTSRPGRDITGKVEAIGNGVTRFKPGDEGFGVAPGAFAEYARTNESKVAAKPVDISFEHAVALPVAGLAALQGVRDYGGLAQGQSVLINGAGGGIGSFTVVFVQRT